MTIEIDPRPAFKLRAGVFGLAAAALLALPAAPARAQSDPVVAKVNGVEIHESDLTMAEEDMGREAQQLPPDQKREQMVAYIADVILAAKAAEDKKVGEQKEFKN